MAASPKTAKERVLTALLLCLPILCLPLAVVWHNRPDPQAATTALARAVSVEDAKAVQAALAQGANVNAEPDLLGGLTPLMIAAFDGRADIVQLLIHAGADVNAAEITTPLDMALTSPQRNSLRRKQDYDKTIRLLRAAGAKTGRERLRLQARQK